MCVSIRAGFPGERSDAAGSDVHGDENADIITAQALSTISTAKIRILGTKPGN